MKGFKSIVLCVSSLLAISNVTNARYISDSDVIRNQFYIEQNAHYNNKEDKKHAALKQEIRNLKNDIKKNEMIISNLERKIKNYQSEQSDLDGQYAMCIARLDMVSGYQKKSVQKDMQNLKKKINSIVQKIDILSKQLNKCKEKLERQRWQLYSLQDKLNS